MGRRWGSLPFPKISIEETFFPQDASSKTLSLFRLLYGLLGVLYAAKSFEFIPFIWFHHSGPQGIGLTPWLAHAAWLILAGCLAGGIGKRWLAIGHFLVARYVLDYESTGTSIEEFLYLIPAFWIIFLDCFEYFTLPRKKRTPATSKRVRAWPVYLLGLNISLLTFIAGVSKILDPLWREGLGFYYFFLSPRVKSTEVLNSLADSRFLMEFANYLTIFFELSALFFFLFNRTRWIAILMFAGFFMGLMGPFSIGFIGPEGLLICLAILSIDPVLRNFRIKKKTRSKISKHFESRFEKRVFVGFVAAMVLFTFDVLTRFNLKYPRAIGPLVYRSENRKVEPPYRENLFSDVIRYSGHLGGAFQVVRHLGFVLFKIFDNHVFNSNHTLGVYQFRILLKDQNEKLYEPTSFFTEDKKRGEVFGLLKPIWIHGSSFYRFSGFAQALQGKTDVSPDQLRNLVVAHANFALIKSGRRDIRSAIVLTSPLTMPGGFEGSREPWKKERWTKMLELDFARRSFRVLNKPDKNKVQYRLKNKEIGGRIETPY